MKRCLLTTLLGAAVVLLAGAGTSNGQDNKYVEDFTTTQYRDSLNTTAWWDTVSGELKLYPFVTTLAGSYDTPGQARDVFIDGNHAFVADGATGLLVVDITNPTIPTITGSFNTSGISYEVVVSGNHAFVADGVSGLQVIDVSNPAIPTLAGSYGTPGNSVGVFVAGDYAFLADNSPGLHVIDISDPASPALLGTYATPGSAMDVFVSGDHAFVACDAFGLQVIDISDQATPTLAGSYDTPGNSVGVFVAGDNAFVADYSTGLQVIDISNPASPTLLGSYDTPGAADKIVVSGDRAYVADRASGLQVIDITNPAAPTSAGSYDTPDYAIGIDVAGEHAFVADWDSGLQVIDVADPVVPLMAGAYDTPGSAQSVFVSGDYAFVADYYTTGLLAIDISDPTAPALVGSYDMPWYAMDVFVAGDHAFVANYESGLKVIDIGDPTAPALVGSYDTPGSAMDVFVAGDYAFVADGDSGLAVIDVSTPSTPTRVGTYQTSDFASDIYISGDHAFIPARNDGLKVIDISDPAAPTLAGSYDTPSLAIGVYVSGDYAFLADKHTGLLIFDISDPTAPTLVGSYDTPDGAFDVSISGDHAFVADWSSGLQVIDVGDPTAPALVGSYDTPGSARGVMVSGDHAFVASSLGGLQVIQVFQGEVDSTASVGRSLALDESNDTILRAWLVATQTDSVSWELSADGGGNWQAVQPDARWNRLTIPGNDLLWRSTLTWMTTGNDPVVSDLTINWIYEYAVAVGIDDVPDDQGGWVRVHFTRSGLDFVDEVSLPIEDYGIWQRVDNPSLIAAVNAAPSSTSDKSLAGEAPVLTGVPVITYEGRTFVQSRPGLGAVSFPVGTWELVLSVPAVQRDDYFARVSTTADSSASGPGYSVYMITAHTTTPSIWYASPPDSGYSVDNIAPVVPGNFALAYNTGAGNYLSWDVCPDDDFQHFNVYRSTDPDFVPSPSTLVHSTIGTDWNDPEYDGWAVYYKITALDYVGNESDPTTAGTATGIEDRLIPKRVTLEQNVPNPFNPTTTISIGLPSAASVTLSVFDVSGRLVRTLIDGSVPAGFQSFVWDGLNSRGQAVASGVYFYRMTTEGYTNTRKMLLMK
jgi:hypothetical protein